MFVGISLIWGSSFLLMAEALEAFTPGVITLGRAGLGALEMWSVRFLLRGGRAGVGPFSAGRSNETATDRPGPRLCRHPVHLTRFGRRRLLTSRGVLLVLFAMACCGFALNMASPLQAGYGGIVLMTNVFSIATVPALPSGLVNLEDSEWRASFMVALAAVGCIGAGLAYWIMGSPVGRVGSIRASLITYLIPAVSLLLGIWLRDDNVTSLALIGTRSRSWEPFLPAAIRSDLWCSFPRRNTALLRDPVMIAASFDGAHRSGVGEIWDNATWQKRPRVMI